MWQVDDTIWPAGQDWDAGSVPEPETAIKDRIFYQVSIPANTTYTVEIEMIVDQKKYVIFQAPEDMSITMWGEEEGEN